MTGPAPEAEALPARSLAAGLGMGLLLAVVWTWPLVLRLSTHLSMLPSAPHILSRKVGFTLQLLRVLRERDLEGLLMYPHMTRLYSYGEWMVISPLSTLCFPEGYNLLIVALQAANFAAVFALLRYLSSCTPAAMAGAALVTWNPLALFYLQRSHLDLVTVFPLALHILALLRWIDDPRPRRLVPVAGWLWVAGFVYWYWGLFSLMAAMLVVGYALLARRLAPRRLLDLGVAYLFCALLAAPMAAGGFQASHSGAVVMSTLGRPFPDLTVLQSASPVNDLALDEARRMIERSMRLDALVTDFPPLATLLAIGLVALFPRGRGMWLAFLFFFMLLSWGPYLRLPAPSAPLREPLFCWLYEHLPLFSRLHYPERFTFFVLLALAALLAMNLSDCFRRLHAPRWLGWGLCLLLVGSFLVHAVAGQQVPLPLTALDSLAACSRQAPAGAGGVIQLPFDTGCWQVSEWSGLYRRLRGCNVVSGMVPEDHNLPPCDVLPADNGFLRALAELSRSGGVPAPPSRSDLEELVTRYRLTHVSLDARLFELSQSVGWRGSYPQALLWLRSVLGEPVCEEPQSATFSLLQNRE